MKGIVKQTYLILGKNNFKLSGREPWVSDAWWGCGNSFISIDGRKYNLLLSKKRPVEYVIPYELFVEDEVI